MQNEPTKITDELVPAKPASKRPILIGLLVGAVPWLLACLPLKNYGAIPFLVLACFGMPIVAAIFAIIPKTRRIGLGLLLASGFGWLVLGAMCSGLFQ